MCIWAKSKIRPKFDVPTKSFICDQKPWNAKKYILFFNLNQFKYLYLVQK